MSWYIDAIPQWSYLILIGLGFIAFFVAAWFGIEWDSGKTLVFGMVGSLVVMIYGIAVVAQDNYHQIRSGQVIATGYQPESTTTACSTANNITTCYPVTTGAYWWIQIRDDNGQTGKIHFDGNPALQHPVGSHYGD